MSKDETFVPGTGGSFAIVDGTDLKKLEGTKPVEELPLEGKVPVPASEFMTEATEQVADAATTTSKAKAKASASD